MDRQKLEQLADGLSEFYNDFKSQLTQTERQAFMKVITTLDVALYSLSEEDVQLLGNEFVMNGSQSMEIEEVHNCGNCFDCRDYVDEKHHRYCLLYNRLIEPFHIKCEYWREKP